MFTKSDVRNGDLFILRNGSWRMVVDTSLIGFNRWCSDWKNCYNQSLIWSFPDESDEESDLTVRRVYRNFGTIDNAIASEKHHNFQNCIFNRDEIHEMTIAEIETKLGINNLKIIKEELL